MSDPSEWNSTHIKSWLTWCSEKFLLNPKPEASKFPDTGLDLCKLSTAEFEVRADNKRCGLILAKHLAHLKHSVTGRPSSPLGIDCDIFRDEKDQPGG